MFGSETAEGEWLSKGSPAGTAGRQLPVPSAPLGSKSLMEGFRRQTTAYTLGKYMKF